MAQDEKFQVPKILPQIQNDQIHLALHTDLCKTEEWKLLPPEKQQLWLEHIQQHFQSAMMAAQQQAAVAPPPPNDKGPNQAGAQVGVQAGAQASADDTGTGGAAEELTPDIGAPPNDIDAGTVTG